MLTATEARHPTRPMATPPAALPHFEVPNEAQRIAAMLELVAAAVPLQRRVVHAGDTIYQAGEDFGRLHIVNAGFFKIVNSASDGREQVVGLQFRGDWLGFDGIATGRYGCDAIAMDTGEIWSFSYEALLQACLAQPRLLGLLHEAMSREISRERDSLLSLCTLSADARVADFLHYWAESLARRGLRADQISLRMSRAEIGNYLGMTIESVSRALSRLSAKRLIRFAEKGRRDIEIPELSALAAFVHGGPAPASLLQ